MNKARRKKIKKAIDMLEMGYGVDQVLDILEDVLYAEEYAYDNIPENLQSSWRAEESEEAIDALNDAIELLTELQSAEGADEDEKEDKIQERYIVSLHIREFNKYPNEKRLCRAGITKKKRGDKPIMSFVFAKKTTVLNNETIKVFCDTKIGLVDGAKGTFSDKQIELIKHYGIVKNTIICPEYSISFAGNNIFHASKLFRRLYEKKCFSRDEVIDLAYEIHKNAINQSDIP